MMRLQELFPTRNRLGEAPLWCANTQRLFWLDILARELFIADFNHASPLLSVQPLPILMTAMDIADADHLIMAGLGGIYRYHVARQTTSLLCEFENEPLGNRPNDGKSDPHGRFWFGTMDNSEQDYTGTLYCYHDGNIRKFHDNIGICNGFGWSPDGQYMYNGDSMRQEIYRYQYDGATGEISAGEVFVSLVGTDIYPDGLCVDGKGNVWSAQWNGWRVIRYNPDGQVDCQIDMPVGCASSCVIGGKDNDRLFITTARKAFSDDELLKQPQAGGLFMLDLKAI